MKKWIACLLTVAVAMSLLGCNPNDVSSEEIRETADSLLELADEMDLLGVMSIDLADIASDEGITASDSAQLSYEGEDNEEDYEVVEDGFETCISAEPYSAGKDFYSYVNHGKLECEKVPIGYYKWNTLYGAREETNRRIQGFVTDSYENIDSLEKDSSEYRIGAFYETMSDFAARNEAGMEPIRKYIDAFDEAQSLDELVDADLNYFKETGCTALLYLNYQEDICDSEKYSFYFGFCSDGLPGKEIITDPEMEDYKNAYLTYLGEIFREAGYDKIEAALKAASAFGLIKEWEQRTLTADESYNPDNIMVYSREELTETFDKLPIDRYLEAYGIDEDFVIDSYCTREAVPFEYLNDIFDDDHIEMLRNLMITRVLSDNDEFLNENMFRFKRKFEMTLSGVTEDKDTDAIFIDSISDMLPADIGRIFAEMYSSPEIKEDVTGIVYEILDTYHAQINECEWMTPETKERAIEKLDKMQVNVAYPDKWVDFAKYADLTAKSDGGTLFDNHAEICKSYNKFMVEAVKKGPDKTEWCTYPHIVNAFYDPNANAITVNAAILQEGIYDVNADAAANLGGIGAIIGHEISHAFDINGAKFDADGNVADWWTPEDYEKYLQICDRVIARYSDFELIPDSGLYVDGNLTISENMADMSGMQVLERLCANDSEMFKDVCIANAKLWGTKITRDALMVDIKTDVHSPFKARVNVPIQMCDLFYEAFDIEQKDAMYIEKDNRIKIW